MALVIIQGKSVLIDDEDIELVLSRKWYWCKGYLMSDEGRKRYRLHRVLLNPLSNMVVDHINGDRSDNRKSNLRLATIQQNNFNIHKIRSQSGLKGVTWHNKNKKWLAQIMKDYKNHNLGYFITKEDAARAYDSAAKAMFGEFAFLNF